jgi:2,5-diketo-D-gluconate reductase A
MDDVEAAAAVATALETGYRLIDTAASYGNETGVGRALAASDVDREDVFVTTKLRGSQHGYESALAGFEESRQRLGLEYLDLFLIHWPLPSLDRYVESWKALVHLREQGLARSIGVSNFTPAQIERLVEETSAWPVVNQVELHPDFAQSELTQWHSEHGIVTEAWSPLARADLLSDPLIGELARSHRRSAGQVVLRWHLQIGTVPIPKSSNARRIAENFSVFEFSLGGAEMAALATLDRGNRQGGDPDQHIEL